MMLYGLSGLNSLATTIEEPVEQLQACFELRVTHDFTHLGLVMQHSVVDVFIDVFIDEAQPLQSIPYSQ